ncbi:sulfatase-like hydrolase/transferase [Porticoccaceae bacterium]|nr:sulfatase-like hydrolase/transferase [Porticoccaceae bacterium]
MKKIIVSILIIVVLGSTVGWYKRTDILLALIKYKSATEHNIAAMVDIPWSQGPIEAVTRPAQRRPNIILIVADDLGFNDISTFGGGVADGRVQTPSIDRLATEGAVFSQSYSGASSCAPSRAMIMTGRYPTRTGFEFTPMPSGMGKTITTIAAEMESGLPPIFHDEALEAGQPPL